MKQNTRSERIAAEIEQQIRSGRLAPGARVPSARELVREHGVALATASRVLGILQRKRLVKVQPGIGTIVKTGERARELSRDDIVRTAIAIADDEGLDALTLRQVAVERGIATIDVQRIFETQEELLLAITDAVLGDVVLPRADSGDYRAIIEAMARAQWVAYGQHPWLVATLSMTRPQLLPNGMRHTELALRALEPLGFDPATTIRTAVTFLAYIRGMAVGLQSERQAEQDTGLSSNEWIESRDALFAPYIPQFPTLGRLARQHGIDMTLDALFERGLHLLLDGLAAHGGKAGQGTERRRSKRRAAGR